MYNPDDKKIKVINELTEQDFENMENDYAETMIGSDDDYAETMIGSDDDYLAMLENSEE